jgi:hypothetical protein
MKTKIKVVPKRLGHIIKKWGDDFPVYEKQDLPKPQQNSDYYLLVDNKWIELYYVNGVFYRHKHNRVVSPFWVWIETMPESEFSKGETLQLVPSKYLNQLGKRLKDGYRINKEHRKLHRSSKKTVMSIRKRIVSERNNDKET